jgi:hypothetical protein
LNMTYLNTLKALVTIYRAAVGISSPYSRYFTVKTVMLSGFRLFWVPEAARDNTKETIVGRKVANDISTHFRSAGYYR